MKTFSKFGLAAFAVALTFSSTVASASILPIPPRVPVVVFPAFHFTVMEVNVQNQIAAPSCTASGVFHEYYQNPDPNRRADALARLHPDGQHAVVRRRRLHPPRAGDLTNDSIAVWSQMHCYHFELNDNVGVDHFELARHPDVLRRLWAHLHEARTLPCS